MKVTIELEIMPEDRREFLVSFAKFFEYHEVGMSFRKMRIAENELSILDLRQYLPSKPSKKKNKKKL